MQCYRLAISNGEAIGMVSSQSCMTSVGDCIVPYFHERPDADLGRSSLTCWTLGFYLSKQYMRASQCLESAERSGIKQSDSHKDLDVAMSKLEAECKPYRLYAPLIPLPKQYKQHAHCQEHVKQARPACARL